MPPLPCRCLLLAPFPPSTHQAPYFWLVAPVARPALTSPWHPKVLGRSGWRRGAGPRSPSRRSPSPLVKRRMPGSSAVIAGHQLAL